ncbi:MAG TPA: DUF6111 family protein [Alphaproteobacteria bacterium]|nr:DUF6111 family protein [Alphaproteobacteria bacterium]
MSRILLQVVAPILLPSVLYALWLVAERRRLEAVGSAGTKHWADAPWLWLLALGVFFAVIITMALALVGGESIVGEYVPPQIKDGRIVPGHVVPPSR